MAKIHIENAIISSSADYSLYHGTTKVADVEQNAIRVQGDIIAENYIVSSSVTYMTSSFASGSTLFGNSADDIHRFTGSLQVSGTVANESYIIGTNVGIGTAAPAGKFHVKDTNDILIVSENAGASEGYLDIGKTGQTHAVLRSAEGLYILIDSDNTQSDRSFAKLEADRALDDERSKRRNARFI